MEPVAASDDRGKEYGQDGLQLGYESSVVVKVGDD